MGKGGSWELSFRWIFAGKNATANYNLSLLGGVLRQGAGQNGPVLPLSSDPISSSQPASSMDTAVCPCPWPLPSSPPPLKWTWIPPSTSSPSCPGVPTMAAQVQTPL